MSSFLTLLLLAPAAASEIWGGYGYYIGDPHAHTGVSGDGWSSDLPGGCTTPSCGAFLDTFQTAADNGLDWVAITDHVNGAGFASSSSEFRHLLNLALGSDDEGGSLVVVPAAEVWFGLDTGAIGHKNLLLFGSDDDLSSLTLPDVQPMGSPTTYIPSCDYVGTWMDRLTAAFGPALLIPHHPAMTSPMPTDWSCHDDVYEPITEVYSRWGTSLKGDFIYDTASVALDPNGLVDSAMNPDGLALRMGFAAGTDFHGTLPGDLCAELDGNHVSTGGLTVAIAPDGETFGRTALYNAMTARRTYATSGPLVPLVVTWFDGAEELGRFGDDLTVRGGDPLQVEVELPEEWDAYVLGVYAQTPNGAVDLEQDEETGAWTYAWAGDAVPAYAYVSVQIDGEVYYGDARCEDYGTDTDEWVWVSPAFVDVEDHDDDGDGVSWAAGDCDDDDAAIHPGAAESWYDGVDEDCDGADDFDRDGDGLHPLKWGGPDCRDDDSSVNPDQAEIYYDGIDQDCNPRNEYDRDGDGYDAVAFGGGDCDDRRERIHPDAKETYYDGVDQDCDGRNDFDRDGDGFVSAAFGGDDCDDLMAATHPGSPEVWYDGIDGDCAGGDDFDRDRDGYRALGFGGTDCDDRTASTHPGAVEYWYDGIDGDCAGGDDYDRDGDGYRSAPWGCDKHDDDASVH